jgi:hypothetical protein
MLETDRPRDRSESPPSDACSMGLVMETRCARAMPSPGVGTGDSGDLPVAMPAPGTGTGDLCRMLETQGRQRWKQRLLRGLISETRCARAMPSPGLGAGDERTSFATPAPWPCNGDTKHMWQRLLHGLVMETRGTSTMPALGHHPRDETNVLSSIDRHQHGVTMVFGGTNNETRIHR